jgi:hypothetical protein
MNIFSANIITGAYAGFTFYNPASLQLGDTVLCGKFLISDGSADSYETLTPADVSLDPITGSNSEQGYW